MYMWICIYIQCTCTLVVNQHGCTGFIFLVMPYLSKMYVIHSVTLPVQLSPTQWHADTNSHFFLLVYICCLLKASKAHTIAVYHYRRNCQHRLRNSEFYILMLMSSKFNYVDCPMYADRGGTIGLDQGDLKKIIDSLYALIVGSISCWMSMSLYF